MVARLGRKITVQSRQGEHDTLPIPGTVIPTPWPTAIGVREANGDPAGLVDGPVPGNGHAAGAGSGLGKRAVDDTGTAPQVDFTAPAPADTPTPT